MFLSENFFFFWILKLYVNNSLWIRTHGDFSGGVPVFLKTFTCYFYVLT